MSQPEDPVAPNHQIPTVASGMLVRSHGVLLQGADDIFEVQGKRQVVQVVAYHTKVTTEPSLVSRHGWAAMLALEGTWARRSLSSGRWRLGGASPRASPTM
jgi:hypothetical protein